MIRRYWYHPESDSYFYTNGEAAAEHVALECSEITKKQYDDAPFNRVDVKRIEKG